MYFRPFCLSTFVVNVLALLCVLAYLLMAEPARCQTPTHRLAPQTVRATTSTLHPIQPVA